MTVADGVLSHWWRRRRFLWLLTALVFLYYGLLSIPGYFTATIPYLADHDFRSQVPVDEEGILSLTALQAGDVVVGIDRWSLEDWRQRPWSRLLRPRPDWVVGQPATLTVNRDGVEETLEVELATVPLLPAIWDNLPVVLAALCFLAVGLFLTNRQPTDLSSRLIFFASLSFFAYIASNVLFGYTNPLLAHARLDVVRLAERRLAFGLASSAALHTFLVFPDRVPILRRRPWFPMAIHLLIPLLLGATLWLAPGDVRERADLVRQVTTLPAVIFLMGAVASLAHTYRTTRDVVVRQQIRWLTWGVAVGLLPSIVLVLIPQIMGLTLPLSPSVVASTIVLIPLTLAVSIVRFRLLDIDVVINRSLVYGLATALLAGFYFLVLFLVKRVNASTNGVDPADLLVLLALLVGISFSPLRDRVQRVLDRTIFGARLSFREVLTGAVEDFQRTIRLNEVAGLLIEALPTRLGIERAVLLVLDDVEHRYRAFGVGEAELAADLDAEGPIGQFLSRTDAIWLPTSGAAAVDAPQEFKALASMGIRHAFPLRIGEQAIGLYAIGAKTSGKLFEGAELDTLVTLSQQISIAVENARLYSAVERQKQNLEVEVEQRTRELSQAYVKLAQAQRQQEEMFQALSHELRTPLTSLLGFNELLLGRDQLPADKKRSYLEFMYEQGQRLSTLVDDLMALSQIESDSTFGEYELLQLDDLLHSAQAAYMRQSPTHNIVLDIEDSVPRLWGHRSSLSLLISNLLSNAIKYSPEGGEIRITCRTEGLSEPLQPELAARMPGGEGPVVVVTFKDEGIGIPPAEIPLIFRKFYRVQRPGRPAVKGSGLGLAICRSIVEKHGGAIWVESDGVSGHGSRFSFALPTAGQITRRILPDRAPVTGALSDGLLLSPKNGRQLNLSEAGHHARKE